MHSLRPSRATALLITTGLIASCASGGGPSAPPRTGSASTVPTAGPTATSAAATATAAPATTAAPTATAGATSTPAATADLTGSLAVLEWSGYEDPLYWADFQAKYPDVAVNFTFGTSDGDILGKMRAGDQSDIFHAYTGWLQFFVDEGLVAEIDTSKLANWDKVPDGYKSKGMFNGKQYFVPWDWGFTSILYRTDLVDSVDSWDVLFDEQYDDHISMWDDGPGAVTISSYIHGWDETAITPEQLEEAKAEWIAQAPLNRLYWAAEYTDLVPAFESNEVWVAYAWQGAYATLLGDGMAVAYADPVEGRNSYIGMYGINADSPNYDLALRYLDEQLGETTGTNLVENAYYGHANSEVMAAITDETLIDAFSLDDPDILEKTNFTPNLTQQQRDDWTQMWAEVKASQ